MKQRLYLINKETGYVITCKDKNEYATFLHFLDDWKPCKIDLIDYFPQEPQEPLIKDEKIRKVVKLWCEMNSTNYVRYYHFKHLNMCGFSQSYYPSESEIGIDFVGWIPTLEDGESYSITELCGEEKKC